MTSSRVTVVGVGTDRAQLSELVLEYLLHNNYGKTAVAFTREHLGKQQTAAAIAAETKAAAARRTVRMPRNRTAAAHMEGAAAPAAATLVAVPSVDDLMQVEQPNQTNLLLRHHPLHTIEQQQQQQRHLGPALDSSKAKRPFAKQHNQQDQHKEDDADTATLFDDDMVGEEDEEAGGGGGGGGDDDEGDDIEADGSTATASDSDMHMDRQARISPLLPRKKKRIAQAHTEQKHQQHQHQQHPRLQISNIIHSNGKLTLGTSKQKQKSQQRHQQTTLPLLKELVVSQEDAIAELSSRPSFSSIWQRKGIVDLIVSGDIAHALQETATYFGGLLQDSREVMFRLRCQQFVELVRANQTKEALQFAQTELTPFGFDSKHLVQLQDTVALLAYNDPFKSPAQHMLQQSARDDLAEAVNAAILCHLGSSKQSALSRIAQQLTVVRDQLNSDSFFSRDHAKKVGRWRLSEFVTADISQVLPLWAPSSVALTLAKAATAPRPSNNNDPLEENLFALLDSVRTGGSGLPNIADFAGSAAGDGGDGGSSSGGGGGVGVQEGWLLLDPRF